MRRLPVPVLALLAVPALAADPPKAPERLVFERILDRHKDLTFDQFHARVGPDRAYLDKLSADPTKSEFFDQVSRKLEMTKEETALFRKTGFVSLDLKRRYSFASAYYHIYTADLPVLVSTDAILHALHRSYDQILVELEAYLFAPAIDRVLADCHAELAKHAGTDPSVSHRDVDLFLTVARSLLAQPGPRGEAVTIKTRFGADDEVRARLADVASLKAPDPSNPADMTAIYGGRRFIDFSQFKPRGHYLKSDALEKYFKCLMWLGRADCGWNVLPTGGTPGVESDADRELRDAVLFVELLRKTDGLKRLKAIDDAIGFLVGKSDGLTVFALDGLMTKGKVAGLADVAGRESLEALRGAIKDADLATQSIRSQIVLSDPRDTYKVPPPSTFRVFGQRYVIDSFVLSQVVYDSIIFKNEKQLRKMPMAADVMAAFGNPEAVPLLATDLRKWNYAANLQAAREFVAAHRPEYWKESVYTLWLDALRALHTDLTAEKQAPEAMRTRLWATKQLQTQLASWAELRRDTVLYAQQSYTASESCEYPCGYVEPYPAFYAKLKLLAEEAGKRLAAVDYRPFAGTGTDQKELTPEAKKYVEQWQKRHQGLFEHWAKTMGTLEALAKKELAGEAFTKEDAAFIKKVIDNRGGGSGGPRYDGWYSRLYYDRRDGEAWDPIVADVHTDPDSKTCLEVGVGDTNLGVFALDRGGKDWAVYVGPLYSYYEFRQPAEKRLQDREWQDLLRAGTAPERPAWVNGFQAPARGR